MTAQQRGRLAPESTLSRYKAFHRVADRGEYPKAFALFKAHPELIIHMTLLEMPCHCAAMSQQLTREQVSQFIHALDAHLKSLQRMLRMARQYDKIVCEQKRSGKSD